MLKVVDNWYEYQGQGVPGDTPVPQNNVQVLLAPIYEVFASNDKISEVVKELIASEVDELHVISAIHTSKTDKLPHITLWSPKHKAKYHARVKYEGGHWRLEKLLDPGKSSKKGGTGKFLTSTFKKLSLMRFIPVAWPHRKFVEDGEKDSADGFKTVRN